MRDINKKFRMQVLCLLLTGISHCIMAQSGQLQLNLLLESNQSLDWTREYPVYLAERIKAHIILGKISNENTLIGLLQTEGTGQRLVLHGIESENKYTLREWLDNNVETGSLRLQHNQDSLWGHWYNERKSLRFDVRSITNGSRNTEYEGIRQYQSDDYVFFTLYNNYQASLLNNNLIDTAAWNDVFVPYKRCYSFHVKVRKRTFCQAGSIGLYYYSHADVVRLIYGYIPQIPHDQIFNSKISEWLHHWANEVSVDSLRDKSEQRWSVRQAIRFIPDYITEELVSGLLTIQYSGDNSLHARSVIYDRKKHVFYTPEDFFRSHTSWNEDFQQTAQYYIFENNQEILEMFPEITSRIKYHLTINPRGLLISTDYNPYFGRLKVQLEREDYEDDLQRFAPLRNFLFK